ncbi:general secretion pathway protein GspB [Pseudomonas sp. 21LCFQ02]|uniref:pilus assembly protein PilZ n=1 Tax=unclassified Pseudomonas TaxID=196821 RepID=UPI0004F6A349|nr:MULTISPECIES: pilus assembly protein PilZ [unclassified Pseudomonas]MCO8171649.1 general secretion pathway protein GspB [Pseudomonas sp. 21LCFQ02]MCQ9425855.1 general secretion pathway protein GspB [Pseudomonas sp. LJDD11]BAP43185.1 type II secretion protein C [Pseudomonas sp. StFLB209]
MSRLTRASHLLLVALCGWLAAQCVLQISSKSASAAAPVTLAPLPQLLSEHWHSQAVTSGDLPLTRLPIEYIGGLKSRDLAATVVVLRFEQRQRTLSRGQRLAPGIVLQDIDERGLIFDNHGQRERLPWPAQRPPFGIKQQG